MGRNGLFAVTWSWKDEALDYVCIQMQVVSHYSNWVIAIHLMQKSHHPSHPQPLQQVPSNKLTPRAKGHYLGSCYG